MKNENLRKVLEKNNNLKIEDYFKKIKIDNYVLEKGQAYAELITKLVKRPVECAGYLISPKSDNSVPKDIFLAYDQHVQDAKVMVSSEGVSRSSNEIKQNNDLIMGAYHSHASFDPFLSVTDDENFNMIKGAIYSNNKKEISAERKILATGPFRLDYSLNAKKDRFIEMISDDFPQKKLYIELNEFFKLSDFQIKKIELDKPTYLNYAVGMIVNANGSSPYFYMAVQDPNTNKEIFLDSIKNFEVEFVPDKENKKPDLNKLEEELINRVYYEGVLLKDILKTNYVMIENDTKENTLDQSLDLDIQKTEQKKDTLFSDKDFSRDLNIYERKIDYIFDKEIDQEKIQLLKQIKESLDNYEKSIDSSAIEDKSPYKNRIEQLNVKINKNKEELFVKLEDKINKFNVSISRINNLVNRYSSKRLVLNRDRIINEQKQNGDIIMQNLAYLEAIYTSLKNMGDQDSEHDYRQTKQD